MVRWSTSEMARFEPNTFSSEHWSARRDSMGKHLFNTLKKIWMWIPTRQILEVWSSSMLFNPSNMFDISFRSLKDFLSEMWKTIVFGPCFGSPTKVHGTQSQAQGLGSDLRLHLPWVAQITLWRWGYQTDVNQPIGTYDDQTIGWSRFSSFLTII